MASIYFCFNIQIKKINDGKHGDICFYLLKYKKEFLGKICMKTWESGR